MAERELEQLGYNLQLIIKRLMANQELLKLLYYTDKDPLSKPDITDEIKESEIFEKLLKIVPRIESQDTAQSKIAMRVVRGDPNLYNPETLDIGIAFDVFVPLTQWFLKNSNLRPFLILGQIKKSLDKKTINGLGKMKARGFELNFLTEEMSAYQISFVISEYE